MELTDQQIVQHYADAGRLNELPPGVYRLPDTIRLTSPEGGGNRPASCRRRPYRSRRPR